MITVKDVWRGPLPGNTELLGGGAGLERRVEWATSLRTRPPAFDAIKGGEIAFIAVRSIKLLDERLDLTKVIDAFAEKRGVAVVVLGDAPPKSIELADRLMLPLLRLPGDTAIAEVQQNTIRFILDQRTELHDRAQELQTELMELALGGAGAAAILDRLAEICDLPAALQDAEGAVLHCAGAIPQFAPSDPWRESLPAIRRFADTGVSLAANPPVREFAVGDRGLGRLVAPIPLRSGVGGFVSVLGENALLGQVPRLATSRAASACAIELDRERAVTAVREDLEGEVLASLLSGSYASEAAMTERARRAGLDLNADGHVIVVRSLNGAAPEAWPDVGVRAAQRWAARREADALVAGHHSAVVVVAMGIPDIRRAAEELGRECEAAMSGVALAAGVGRAKSGLAGLRASHREAEQAISMGSRLAGASPVTSFADLGLHRLLFAVAQHNELHDFFREQLGTLQTYDQERGGGELLRTLDAFFRSHGSPTEAAAGLHVHRNTVLYRLRRVEEIAGIDLDDAVTRLNLQLCLRIREVLAATG
ncbi:MAG: helix-turn-helix domain-containing protein [Candidatus Dormibacteria bacterium]